LGGAREAVLILQIGSLGDTVISLPCYREIARRHPQADRYLMTNFPIGRKMDPAESIFGSATASVGMRSQCSHGRHKSITTDEKSKYDGLTNAPATIP
jgi:hypothetical protein